MASNGVKHLTSLGFCSRHLGSPHESGANSAAVPSDCQWRNRILSVIRGFMIDNFTNVKYNVAGSIYRRDENPMCLVYILFPCASAVPALSQATALTGEVKTPSNRCAENTIRSPLRAVHCCENRKKQQSKMLNLCLNRLSCSTVLAPVQWRLWWQMSESRRRPVIAPDAVFRQSFQRRGERGQRNNRRKPQYFAHSNTSKNRARSQATTRFDALFES